MSPWMRVYILLVKTDLNFCLEHHYAHPVCWWSSVACSTTTTFNSSLFLSNNYNLMLLICPIFPFSFLPLQSLLYNQPHFPLIHDVTWYLVLGHTLLYTLLLVCVWSAWNWTFVLEHVARHSTIERCQPLFAYEKKSIKHAELWYIFILQILVFNIKYG